MGTEILWPRQPGLRFRAFLCGICDRQIGPGTVLLRVLLFIFVSIFYQFVVIENAAFNRRINGEAWKTSNKNHAPSEMVEYQANKENTFFVSDFRPRVVIFCNLIFLWAVYVELFAVQFVFVFIRGDRLCGLVVRVSGYRYRGLGFDSRRYQIFWVVAGLERGPLSLVRSIEELLE